MRKKVARLPMETSFADVKKLIQGIVTRLHKAYHIPSDEAWSAAGLGYCQAFNTFDPTKGFAFTTWVQWKVEMRLTDLMRERAAEATRAKLTAVRDLDDIARTEAEFDVFALYSHLSRDGIKAVSLALTPPLPLKLMLRSARQKGEDAVRRAMVRYLRERGWSAARIEVTFANVRRAL